MDRGHLAANILAGVERLYHSNRADTVWSADDIAAFAQGCPPAVRDALDLALCTGLRRTDLAALTWQAIGDHAIIWETSKSRGKKRTRRRATVPLLPQTRALLARIKQARTRDSQPLTGPILLNSRGGVWTPSGLGHAIADQAKKAAIEKHLHDARGTFVTRCMTAPGGMTVAQIANILGWSEKNIGTLRARYVSDARVVIEIGKRIAQSSGV